MKERLFRILNIKLSESKYVFDLLSIQLFIGIANSLVNIVAFTYFIYKFSITGLPPAYIAIAGVLLILNLVYERAEEKLSPLHLLRVIIFISAVILFIFWYGLWMGNKSSFIFLLLVWSTLFYMTTGYAYWGLVSLLFNIRESKRVFSIVGSGDIPAKLIGYLSAPLLIPIIGLENLLLLAIVSLFTGLFLLNRVIRKKNWENIRYRVHSSAPVHRDTYGASLNSLLKFFFRHKLIFIISVLSILSYNVFNLIDYTFVSQVKTSFHDVGVLAYFIAVFFAIGRFIALVLKLVFTSRAIERLGLIPCLMITPATLALFSFYFLFFHPAGNYSLYLFGLMAMITEVLRSTMQEPVFFILFQPLHEHTRLKGHIIAKGYMLAPSLFIVGGSLVLMRSLGAKLDISFTIQLLCINLVIWAVVIYFIRKEYILALRNSIARGVYNAEDLNFYDRQTIGILLNKIERGTQSEKIYALKLLENSGYREIDHVLREQLKEKNSDVRKYVLDRMEERNQLDTFFLKTLLEEENDPLVKAKIINLLCKADTLYLRALSENMSVLDATTRTSVILHLLNQNEFSYLYKAGNEINNLIHSSSPSDKVLALDIISRLKHIKFTDSIESLINDEDSSVKRHALLAACKLKSKKLLPAILQRLKSKKDKFITLQGLFQYGDSLFRDIHLLQEEELCSYRQELIKIAQKARGPYSTDYLISCLHQSADMTEKIIHALWSKGFAAIKSEDISRFNLLLNYYLQTATEKIYYHNGVPEFSDKELITQSFASEIWNDLLTSLKICGILYHNMELNRVIELVENRDKTRLYNAMEMLEMVLPKKIASQINDVLDYMLDPAYIKNRFAGVDLNSFFNKVVVSQSETFNTWTRSICLFAAFKNQQFEFLRSLDTNNYDHENPVIRETRAYVLKTIQSMPHAHY